MRHAYAPPKPADMHTHGLPVPPIRRRSSIYVEPDTQPLTPRRRRHIPRWLRLTLFFMLVSLVVGIAWLNVVVPWWNGVKNRWNYGQSGIVELDANFGHGGEEHIIAEFYRGDVLVFEVPLSAPNRMKVYLFGVGYSFGDHPALTLSVERDRDTGRPDLLIQIEGDPIGYILYNTGTGFSANGG
jgi:hypothetical protein